MNSLLHILCRRGGGIHAKIDLLVQKAVFVFDHKVSLGTIFGGRLLASVAGLRLSQNHCGRANPTPQISFSMSPRMRRGCGSLITEDCPENHFVIEHENNLLHKKIYFGADSAPSPTKNVQ